MNRPVLNLEEAANLLGYSTRAMRTLIARSKRRAVGLPVKGPTIKFFQPGPRASIRFRREWLAEFVQQNTVDPAASPLIGSVPRKSVAPKTPTKLDLGPRLPGFPEWLDNF